MNAGNQRRNTRNLVRNAKIHGLEVALQEVKVKIKYRSRNNIE